MNRKRGGRSRGCFLLSVVMLAMIFAENVNAGAPEMPSGLFEEEETAPETSPESPGAEETVRESPRVTPGVEETVRETASALPEEEELTAQTEEILAGMTLEEKICQLFVITPEALTGSDSVTAAGERTREAIHATPVAGLVYFNENLEEAGQIWEMLANTQKFSLERMGLPMLLAVDEEGGSVRRINGRGITPDEEIPPMCEVQDPAYAYEIGCKIGAYLSDLGFNVDFAPVADVLTNPENAVVRERSFGSDPDQVAALVASVVRGLRENGIAATLKHFPGHGSTSEDSHAEYACSYQTEEELFRSDLVPFLAGVREGAELIMAGHISLPNLTGDLIPASLNRLVLTSILREKMHYDGIVITDALNMGAITEHYDSADAAVMAVQAGCDLLLMPADFHAARSGIRSAVENGVISEERIDESVRRVITLRLGM